MQDNSGNAKPSTNEVAIQLNSENSVNIDETTRKNLGASQVTEGNVSSALASIFSWRNYRIYLVTAWMFSAASVINSFFNLYVRAIGWDFTAIGSVIAVTSTMALGMRITGGYVGDVVDRKMLSVIAMGLAAIYFLLMGLFADPIMIILALFTYSTIDIAKGGSSAYILDNTPKEHSGLALALFNAGRAFGVFTLIVFNLILPIYGFPESFRIISIIAGIILTLCTLLRQAYLDPSPPKENQRDKALWRDFLSENWRAVRTMVKVLPGALIVITLDGFSDSLFNFGALLYANEYLNISINSIGIMLTINLIVSVPLLLKVGRLSDRWGVRKSSIIVYSMMPLCMILLVLAPQIPLWAPQYVVDGANALIDGLGVVFTTAFVAIVMKRINDSLWWLIVTTMIQKNLPHKDTSKFLAAFWYIVYLAMAIGPMFGGLVFTYLDQPVLFMIAFLINVVILYTLLTRGLISDKADEE